MAEVVGWFGKMPALGDFASRRLPDAWRDAWDAWLQRELVSSREQLGDEAWLSLYMVAPVRRFWLARGLLTRDAWIGVLMPSVDSVGRQFPFTLAAAVEHGRAELVDALANNDWLDAAEALARQVLDPSFEVEALEQAIAALPGLHGERRLEAHAGSALAQALGAARVSLRSAWWCEGASRADQFLCSNALPCDAAFTALLHDGD